MSRLKTSGAHCVKEILNLLTSSIEGATKARKNTVWVIHNKFKTLFLKEILNLIKTIIEGATNARKNTSLDFCLLVVKL